MSEHTSTPQPKPIVVGVDGSESSIDALRRAAKIAEDAQAPLHAVITWENPSFVVGGFYATGDWNPQQNARDVLLLAAGKAFPEGTPDNLTMLTVEGPPAYTLIEESRRAGMLVLGSRGHGGFAGLLLGSVSAACAEHAHCPVLIVHEPEPAKAA